MAVTNISDLTNVGNIADGDTLVGERVSGTTVNINFNGVLLDSEFDTNGLMTRTAAGTYTERTITGTASRISVSNGDGQAGNPTIDIDAAYVGQATITTLGTIATGTWQGTAVGVAYGGTGQTTYTNGQLLIGNTTGNTLTKATLSEGEGIDITNGTGSITIAGEDASDTNKGIASFDATDFTVSSGDVTVNAERIQDIAGAMVTGNTETNITVTYQDVDGTIDFEVSDSFLLNTGDIGTGSYDFGGADDFEIPNGTNPTVDTAGQIAMDTDGDGSSVTHGVVECHDGATQLYLFPATGYPSSDNDVMAYDSASNSVTWQAQAGGGGGKPDKEITYLPGSFESNNANPAALVFLNGTNVDTMVRAFDDTTVEYVEGKFVVPGDVNTSGTVTLRTYSMAATTAASKNVEYTFEHLSLNDAEDFDPTSPYTSEVSGDLAVDTTQDNIQEDTWTETISNLGWAANDIVLFRLSRTEPSANDLTGDLYLFSFTIEIPRT